MLGTVLQRPAGGKRNLSGQSEREYGMPSPTTGSGKVAAAAAASSMAWWANTPTHMKWLLAFNACSAIFTTALIVTVFVSGVLFYRSDTAANIADVIQNAKTVSDPNRGILLGVDTMVQSLNAAMPESKAVNMTNNVGLILEMVVANQTNVAGTINGARILLQHFDSLLRHINENKGINMGMNLMIPLQFSTYKTTYGDDPDPHEPTAEAGVTASSSSPQQTAIITTSLPSDPGAGDGGPKKIPG